jgi:Xaa-Pro aminopeptidase
MRNGIFKSRIKKVTRLLRKKQLDALIITCGANISYLSGFFGDDSWLILTAKDVWLVTDSRYTLQAKRECPACKIYERKGKMTEAIADVLKKLPAVRVIAVEDKIELSVFNILCKKLGRRLKTAGGLIESVRQVKDKFEIRAIRKAAAIAQKALGRILKKIHTGASEIEIAAMLEFELKRAGMLPAFETIVAFGTNSAMPHHRPTAKKLKKVDTILIDFGAKLNGYCCDLTRCFAVGRVNDFYRKVYKAVFEAQSNALRMVKTGVKAKKIDIIAKEILAASKLPPYGHGLGHGVGLEVHELPVVSVKSNATLAQGNVITIEPAVYWGGRFGIRIEDDVLVTDKGCKVLTTRLKNDQVPVLNKIKRV